MDAVKLIGPILGIAAVGALFVALRQSNPPAERTDFTHDAGAVAPSGRARQAQLTARLGAAPHTLRELPDGYSLTYYDGRGLLPEASEWLALETRSCPFLDLSIAVLRDNGALVVKMSGAQGVKAFLKRDLAPMLKKP